MQSSTRHSLCLNHPSITIPVFLKDGWHPFHRLFSYYLCPCPTSFRNFKFIQFISSHPFFFLFFISAYLVFLSYIFFIPAFCRYVTDVFHSNILQPSISPPVIHQCIISCFTSQPLYNGPSLMMLTLAQTYNYLSQATISLQVHFSLLDLTYLSNK